MTQLEGSGAMRLLRLFRETTQPTTLSLATVTSPPPSLSIRIDGDSFDTPMQGLVVAEHLTQHKRTMRVNDSTYQQYEIQSNLNVGDRVIVAIANDGQLVYVLDKAVV